MSEPTYIDWKPGTPVVTKAGETSTWRTQVRDGAGVVVDIAGWTFGFKAVEQEGPVNIIEVVNADFEITDHAEGQVEWPTAAAQTGPNGGKNFQAELWRRDAGFEHCVADGPWEIQASIWDIEEESP